MGRKHFDFCIKNTKWHREIIRQYPKRTHVHGFSDFAPTEWKQVYKTYYSWCIMRQSYDEDGKLVPEKTIVTFPMYFDEASVFPNLAKAIDYVHETGEAEHIRPLGQPGAEWKIAKRYRDTEEIYDFEVFDNYYNNGYRFSLTKTETEKFCEWIETVNAYALSRSEPV